jgi:hypothetical protein
VIFAEKKLEGEGNDICKIFKSWDINWYYFGCVPLQAGRYHLESRRETLSINEARSRYQNVLLFGLVLKKNWGSN